ncbi:MAG: FtsX-like permease family protein [Bacteroidales bacterium]|nr:FtsX-like permease family protein [Bacteroidales bacterium]
MKLEFFMAKRLISVSKGKITSSAVKIAVISVSLSVAVMLISMAVIIGFKNEIVNKAIGFSSAVNIVNRESAENLETKPISIEQDFYPLIENEKGITKIQPYIIKPAVFKSETQIMGVALKGISSVYDNSFFEKNMVSGVFEVNDTTGGKKIVISKKMADLLNLHSGDNLIAYFIQNPLRMRKFIISGIYSTGLEEYDKLVAFVDMSELQKLNSWTDKQITGFEVMIDDFSHLDEMTELVRNYAGYKINEDGSMLKISSVKENNRQLFDWITLTEMNVWVILAIMFFVAFINMSTALLIIIFEKASMIGLMKAVGSTNWLIRKIFILQSLYILLRGIIIGDVIAMVVILLQHYFHLIPLDSSSYYVDYVPSEFQLWYFIAIDIATVLIMSIMLIIPSFAVSKMQPAKVIGFK